MPDRNTQVALDRFTSRMLSQYVSPWEFEQLKRKIQSWDQWCEEWSKAARLGYCGPAFAFLRKNGQDLHD